MTKTDDLIERVHALADCAYWAKAGWDIPGDATQVIGKLAVKAAARLREQAAEIARLTHSAPIANVQLSGDAEYWKQRAEKAEAERDEETAFSRSLEDVLRRNGFDRCNIPACNCGSWHQVRGLPERWREISEDLENAGHSLTNENGHVLRTALAALIAERDALRQDAERLIAACNGMIGLVQLIASRPDLPVGLDDVMLLNHRVTEAKAAIDSAMKESAK